MECAEELLSLVRRSVKVMFKPPISSSEPLIFMLFPTKGRGGKRRINLSDLALEAQYPVVAPGQNPFKLCDFPLVTPARLRY